MLRFIDPPSDQIATGGRAATNAAESTRSGYMPATVDFHYPKVNDRDQ
jgi:hypothetical protein